MAADDGDRTLLDLCNEGRAREAMQLLAKMQPDTTATVGSSASSLSRMSRLRFETSTGPVSGFTPLHALMRRADLALEQSWIPFLRLAATFGVDLDAQDTTPQRWTALHHASRFGHRHLALELLTLGADPAVEDAEGKTAADIAEERQRPTLAAQIREHAGAGTRVKSALKTN
jgi:ankyrin repeat protein